MNFLLLYINTIFHEFRNWDFIKALYPVSQVMQQYHADVMYRIQWTGQVASLEAFLNVEYGLSYDVNNRATQIAAGTIIYIEGPELNRIYLRNKIESSLSNKTYIRNKSESTPANKTFLRSKSEASTVGITPFIVKVPVSLVFDQTIMEAQIRLYAEASKSFTIQTY